MKNWNPKFVKFILACSSAILFFIAWPAAGFAPLLFISLVPLLKLEDDNYKLYLSGTYRSIFWFVYLSFFLFNILTTWWIYFASGYGMIGAVVANSFLMTITFQLFHYTRKKLGSKIGYLSLFIYWLSFEYLHMNWDLTWPWLTLGNGFAAWANMVQWYEYTGVFGGTIWIILANIYLFKFLSEDFNRKLGAQLAGIILLPLAASISIYYSYTEKENPIEVIAVQPNIDPYNEKFSGMSSKEQLDKMLRLAQPLVSDKTALVICPETALANGIWKIDLLNDYEVNTIRKFVEPYPNLNFLTGLTLYEMYSDVESKSATARKFRDSNSYFDVYNAAMQINNRSAIQLHYKSKLVPGVEKMPFPAIFGLLDDFAIDLGGTAGSLGMQAHPSVFRSGKITAAPVVCYESVYGDYVREYINQGANIICIMTNDGWWEDTPGYRQHCQYARLRAIEERRSIVRSANTGISCFIDQRGEIHQATKWWMPTAIKSNLNLNEERTFYARCGDFPAYIALIALIPMLLFAFFKKKRNS
jgi:apolipoprotein N-acyltransferase